MSLTSGTFYVLFLCGTGVALVLFVILGVTVWSVFYRIRLADRTDRISKLNPALAPLTLSIYRIPTRYRGSLVQYRGQVGGHSIIFQMDAGTLLILVAGQYPVPVSISRPAPDKTPANPGQERHANQFSELKITTADDAWCEALVADPIGHAALLRLMASQPRLVPAIAIKPDSLSFFLRRPLFRFYGPLLTELDYGLFRPWIDDAVRLAQAAESAPRPKWPSR